MKKQGQVTADDGRIWAKAHADELRKALAESKGVPDFLKKMPEICEIWNAGSWLKDKLTEAGCPHDENEDIQHVCGQRSFGSDPYKEAASLLNEYLGSGTVADKPGFELAEKITDRNLTQAMPDSISRSRQSQNL